MWTPTTRQQHSRPATRYQTDLTDAEWHVIAPLVDTDGRGLVLEPHSASIQDRDSGGPLLQVSRYMFPFIQRVFADSGYAGEKVNAATLIAVEIVRKNPDQVGFAINPRRWVVERFFAWIGRNRRLAKDFEATIDSTRAFLYVASVMLLVRRSVVLHDFRNRL